MDFHGSLLALKCYFGLDSLGKAAIPGMCIDAIAGVPGIAANEREDILVLGKTRSQLSEQRIVFENPEVALVTGVVLPFQHDHDSPLYRLVVWLALTTVENNRQVSRGAGPLCKGSRWGDQVGQVIGYSLCHSGFTLEPAPDLAGGVDDHPVFTIIVLAHQIQLLALSKGRDQHAILAWSAIAVRFCLDVDRWLSWGVLVGERGEAVFVAA